MTLKRIQTTDRLLVFEFEKIDSQGDKLGELQVSAPESRGFFKIIQAIHSRTKDKPFTLRFLRASAISVPQTEIVDLSDELPAEEAAK